VCLEALAALIERNRVLEVDLAVLKLGDDFFEFLERGLKGKRVDRNQ
jgi:hypothetical protein